MTPTPTARTPLRAAFALAATLALALSLFVPTAASAAPIAPEAATGFPVHALFTPNDPYYGSLWGLPMIQAPTAWNTLLGSKSVIVAVVDTGVWYTDTDIAANMWNNTDGTHGYDFISNTEYPMDQDTGTWHGTGVAGVIGAITDNGYELSGVCQCAVMALRALSSSGTGSSYNVSLAIRWAADHGAKVINLSLGTNSTFSGPTDIQLAIDYAWSKGALIVAAAGNDGANSLDYPASLPDVVAVGAVGQNGQRAAFSNYGPGLSLMAPGVDIITLANNNNLQFPQGLSGTSLATPYVSGVAGLVLSLAAQDGVMVTNKDLWNILNASAAPAGPASQYGWGIVDAAKALQDLNQPFVSVNSYPSSVSRSTAFSVRWTVFGPQGLAVSDTHVLWGTDPNRLGNATAAQSGTTRENYTASGLQMPSSASTLYFQVAASVNGTVYSSRVYSVSASSLPDFLFVLYQLLSSNLLILALFILALAAIVAFVPQRRARSRRAAYRTGPPMNAYYTAPPAAPASGPPAASPPAVTSQAAQPPPIEFVHPPSPPAAPAAPPMSPPMPAKIRCPSCGTAVNADNTFCFFCGNRIR